MEICIVHNIVHNYLHRIHLVVTNSFSYSIPSYSTAYNTLNSHCRYSVAVSVGSHRAARVPDKHQTARTATSVREGIVCTIPAEKDTLSLEYILHTIHT